MEAWERERERCGVGTSRTAVSRPSIASSRVQTAEEPVWDPSRTAADRPASSVERCSAVNRFPDEGRSIRTACQLDRTFGSTRLLFHVRSAGSPPGQENEAPGPVLVEPKESQLIRMKKNQLFCRAEQQFTLWSLFTLCENTQQVQKPVGRPAGVSQCLTTDGAGNGRGSSFSGLVFISCEPQPPSMH
ncbi:hypothetical protein CCH79_00019303 [Gambusia affinis]|uniref:Uncharacterized protein n=1 Tax=Gambusia affinis TaxID=33528 RepID=A0A315WCN9_GAMAF|nr:hypothetical protein CCH79_00019303 [Gambusia affinis]